VPSSWALSSRKTAKRKMLSKNRKRGMCFHLPRKGPLGSTTVSVGLLVFGGHRDNPFTDPLVKRLKTSIGEKMCTLEMSPIAALHRCGFQRLQLVVAFCCFLLCKEGRAKKCSDLFS
jgi:hypothetical protein